MPNDDIERRRVLQLEETVTSSTTGCTVQRGCVDEQLTGQCIQYHNDQWFEFTPRTAGRYYVNIGGQRCRDVRGVQLVVLTGTPCQPATYRILSCTSLGNQDDVFVELNDLQAGQPYLLNVDGYLHDFCQFTLAVSQTPHGQPLTLPVAGSTAAPVGRFVTLRWTLPDSVAPARFTVRRREGRAFRSAEVGTVEARRNVSGEWVRDYTLRDTLPAVTAWSRFEYRILAQTPTGADVVIGTPVVNLKPVPGAGQRPSPLGEPAPQPAAAQESAFLQSAYPATHSLAMPAASSRPSAQAAEDQKEWERRSQRARKQRTARLRRESKP